MDHVSVKLQRDPITSSPPFPLLEFIEDTEAHCVVVLMFLHAFS